MIITERPVFHLDHLHLNTITQGALKNKINQPGVHWKIPFVTTIEEIAIRPITDTLAPTKAVTKDSITVNFQGIQVISQVKREKLVGLIRTYGRDFIKVSYFPPDFT